MKLFNIILILFLCFCVYSIGNAYFFKGGLGTFMGSGMSGSNYTNMLLLESGDVLLLENGTDGLELE